MKRAFLLLLLGALTAGTVRADYLYWMIGDVNPDVKLNDDAYGRVGVVKLNATAEVLGYLPTPDGDGLGLGSEAIFSDFGAFNKEEYGFFVEVWNYGVLNTQPTAGDQWYVAGVSEIAGYTTLVDALHVAHTKLDMPNIQAAWAPTVSVPEPSSGLLALLGMALLALRRRRA